MQSNYIYSKIAAAGLFPQYAVKSIEVFHNAVNVHLYGHRSVMVSKKKFLEYFAKSRRERGQKLKASRINLSTWHVQSGTPRTHPEGYSVELDSDQGSPRLKCDCHDFSAQQEYGISTPCCKHLYSVLDSLGFDSYHVWIGETEEEMIRDHQINYEELSDVDLVALCEA